MSRRARTLPPTLAVLTLLLAGACADPRTSATPAPAPATRGTQPMLVLRDDASSGFLALVSGRLTLNPRGCVLLGGALVVAPPGSTMEGGVVRVPGYADARLGSRPTYGGGLEELVTDRASRDARRCVDYAGHPDEVVVISHQSGSGASSG